MTKTGRLARRWERVKKNPSLAMRRFVQALDRMDRKISGHHVNPETWENYESSGLIHKGRKP